MYDMHTYTHEYAQTYHKHAYAGMVGSPIAPVTYVSLTPVSHIRYGGEPDPAFVHIMTKEGESFVDTGLNARHAREGQVGTACVFACMWVGGGAWMMCRGMCGYTCMCVCPRARTHTHTTHAPGQHV